MFNRPGITQLRDQIVNDVRTALGLPTLLRRSPLRAMAYGQAGVAHGHYGYLDWIARQSVPFTATGVFLEAWAALVKVWRKAASPAAGTASFVGDVGVPIPVGTVLRGQNEGSYITLADLTLAGNGTDTVAIRAQTAGSAYTLVDDMPLVLASPIPGVQSSAVGQPGVAGADPELDAPFRTRMLLQYAAPPQGGAASDYVEWALAVPGVTRAWPNPTGAGAGTVVVYTMWDAAEASHGGFPQGSNGVAAAETRDAPATGDQLAVANTLYPLRPVTALVYSCAPIPYPVAFTLRPLSAVSQVVRDQVLAAIDAVFLAYADPLGSALALSLFEAAIAAVPGMPAFTLTEPASAIQAPLGYLPVRGAASYA